MFVFNLVSGFCWAIGKSNNFILTSFLEGDISFITNLSTESSYSPSTILAGANGNWFKKSSCKL